MNTPPAVPFENLSNFRDLGGYPMRNGILFRSGDLSRTTPQDVAQLESLGIKLICDLRVPAECRKRPPRSPWRLPVQTVNISLHSDATHRELKRKMIGWLFRRPATEACPEFIRDYYHHLAVQRNSHIGEVVTLLAKENSLPALIHCTAGKDRTGVIVAILQMLAGVPYERVIADYLQTNEHYEPRIQTAIRLTRILTLFRVPEQRIRQVLMAHREALDAVFEHIFPRYGSVENYLAESCNVDIATLRRLKQRLLAAPPPG